MNKRFKNIESVIEKGNMMMKENHPASKTIKSFVETLANRWNWLHQLSYLLGVHLKNLNNLEIVSVRNFFL